VGGGIRSAEVIEDLISSGIERVVIGSAAVERPDDVMAWTSRFGADRICLALDVRHDRHGAPQVRTRGWKSGTAISLWEALDVYPAAAVRHVLCTDIERDGALTGPNLDLYREAVERLPRIGWQASGGVRDAADLDALDRIGAAAAVSGKALLEERIKPQELRRFLPDASFPA
jgi:phosphoribosylformimino-5-aminoimidazole carboxamide ribotide isomerase